MRYGTIPLVGGRSRTSSPSGRRQSMGADASHGPVAIPLRLRGVISPGGDAETESTVTVAFADLLAHPDVVEEQVLAARPPGSAVGFLALHGGLEPGTAEIAVSAARRA